MTYMDLSLEEKWKIVEEKSCKIAGMLNIMRDAMFYREDEQRCGDLAVQAEVIIEEMKKITSLF